MSDHGVSKRVCERSTVNVNPSRTEVLTLRRAIVRGPETGRSGRRGYVCSPNPGKEGGSDVDTFFVPYFLD